MCHNCIRMAPIYSAACLGPPPPVAEFGGSRFTPPLARTALFGQLSTAKLLNCQQKVGYPQADWPVPAR